MRDTDHHPLNETAWFEYLGHCARAAQAGKREALDSNHLNQAQATLRGMARSAPQRRVNRSVAYGTLLDHSTG